MRLRLKIAPAAWLGLSVLPATCRPNMTYQPEWGRVGWRSGKPRTSRDRDARLALIGIDLIQFESV